MTPVTRIGPQAPAALKVLASRLGISPASPGMLRLAAVLDDQGADDDAA